MKTETGGAAKKQRLMLPRYPLLLRRLRLLPNDKEARKNADTPAGGKRSQGRLAERKTADAQEDTQQRSRGIGWFIRQRGGIPEGCIPEQAGSKRRNSGKQEDAQRRKPRPVLHNKHAGTGQQLQTRGIEQRIKSPFRPGKTAKKSAANAAAQSGRRIEGCVQHEDRRLPRKRCAQQGPDQPAKNADHGGSHRRAGSVPGP